MVHAVQVQVQLLPLHGPQTQKCGRAGVGTTLGNGRDQQAAAWARLIDVQALGIAGIGDKGRFREQAALMHVAQCPGVQASGFKIVQ